VDYRKTHILVTKIIFSAKDAGGIRRAKRGIGEKGIYKLVEAGVF